MWVFGPLPSMATRLFCPQRFTIQPENRVGKYGVKPEVLESLVLPYMDPYRKRAGLIVVEEFFKMGLLFQAFRETLVGVFDWECPLLATISLKGGGPIKRIKEREDVLIFVSPSSIVRSWLKSSTDRFQKYWHRN